MGWAKTYPSIDTVPVDKTKYGYGYKLCPYSTAYRDQFRYIGTIYTGLVNGVPSSVTGDLVVGNSTNQDLYAIPYSGYPCSEHTTTQGRMVAKSNPPGWYCSDPNCYYFSSVVSGECYKEV